MLTETQVIKLKNTAVAFIMKAEQDSPQGKRKLPDFNPIYIETVEEADRIGVHADGNSPIKLFHKRAPNQNQEEFEYALDIYKARTMSFWEKMLGTVGRIWNKNNFTVKDWETPPGAETFPPETYFTQDYPQYKSIFSYFELVVTPFKMKDANAVIVYKPIRIPVNERGEVDQTAPIEPVAIIYGSHQVIFFQEEIFTMIQLEEKSWIKQGNTRVKEGLIFEIYDDVNIWRITQIGTKGARPLKFDIILFFAHNLGYLPAKKLRGRPQQIETEILYHSYMIAAVPSLDSVAINYNNLDVSNQHSTYPHKWEYVEECDNPDCVDGRERDGDTWKICGLCLGTNRKNKIGRAGVTEVKIPQSPMDGDLDKIQIPPYGWVGPDVTTLEFLLKTINQDINISFAMLNIDVSNSSVKGSETALGKMIDREELFSWLTTISTELFDCLDFSIQTIGIMRYGEKFESPVIIPPVNFSIRSADELIEELKKAVEAKLPLPAVMKILREFLAKRFNQDKKLDTLTNLVFSADRLLMFTPQEIAMKRDKSIVRFEEVLHDSIFFFIDEAISENEDFLDLDLANQLDILKNKAIAKAAEIPSVRGTTENLLEAANNNAPPTP